MVLVVVAHVEGEEVEWAVVGVGLLLRGEDVVLGDEVACARNFDSFKSRQREQMRGRGGGGCVSGGGQK
eukprot:CAMPEP_0179888506 /NCGR_PEP_ID=MMETSP0982-20121206/32006_1 /TAXON_ID=483367 /ORGANISM="non described non described, Strain CCMP 2436" /LENGTH=68 /DNA_ID=CAMNT_0021784469 /DNA_START=427 /DNA_END=633 /DNA_ORIENTATION=-